MKELEVVGETIHINLIAGGIDKPTFHRRRKVVLTAYVQEESIQLYREPRDAALALGRQLGGLLHEGLAAGGVA
jgi:hypothetical protein